MNDKDDFVYIVIDDNFLEMRSECNPNRFNSLFHSICANNSLNGWVTENCIYSYVTENTNSVLSIEQQMHCHLCERGKERESTGLE